MDRQRIYLSPELMKQFGAPVNIVASIICLLSKDGKQRVTATEQYLADRTFLSTRLVSKAKRILKAHGYINIATSSVGFKRYSVITTTAKLIQAFFIPDTNDTVCDTDNAQCAISTQHSMPDRYSTECSDHTHSVRTEIAQYAVCDYAQCADKHNKNTITEHKGNTNIRACEKNDDHAQMSANDIHDFLTIPVADDYDFEDHDELKNDITEQVEPITLTSNPPKAEPPQAEEKKSSAKRKERKTCAAVEYPKNAAEVLKLMQDWKAKHISVEPRIQGVNIALESEKFFNYWEANNWTNKRGKIKSVNSTIATWLGFAIERVKGNFTAPEVRPVDENGCPMIKMDEAIAKGLCKDLYAAMKLANKDGWIREDQLIKEVKEAEFEIIDGETEETEQQLEMKA